MSLSRWLTAAGLFVVAFVAVMQAQRHQGVARDEVVYMTHGTRYVDWWSDLFSGKRGTLTEDAITGHFGGPGATANNREHPPLMKTLMGISERVVHRKLGWTDRISAYRIPSAAMNALLVALMYVLASGLRGHAAGILAALLTLLLPRAFFHAGLAAFDAAMVTMWMATLMAYLAALRSARWCLGLGLVFGLSLATKHNAIMLPAVLLGHYVYVGTHAHWPADARGLQARLRALPRALWRGALGTRPLILPALLVLGPLVLVALWPWLWFDTAAHAAEWIRFHLAHVHYNFEYLGQNWNAPPFPWHVPVVTTLLTVPVITLAAAVCGAVVLGRGRGRAGQESGRAPVLLLLISAAVAMGPFVTGRVPIFGAEKHWAPAIPTLCVLAGVGLVAMAELAAACLGRVVSARRPALVRRAAVALVGGLAVAAALAETWTAQPYALSHYNALAGGAPGGADLGMNRHFWGYAARGVLGWLEDGAPGPGQAPAPVYTHDASPAWGVYQAAGLVSRTLPDAGHEAAGIARSRFALVVHERHFARHDFLIWSAYGTVQPRHVLTFQGVPIVSVYERPPAPPGR